jgi:prepilin-type N-terminal cleavage/methylation domain-containing protein
MDEHCPPSPLSRPVPAGFTLVEVITAVALLAIAMAALLPAARRWLDRLAVVGAREEVMGLFHQARLEAVAHGGATVLLTCHPPVAELRAGSVRVGVAELVPEYGVALSLSRDRERAEVTYDAMGLGRVASQTLRITRGAAEAGLVISSFGRVVRR